MGNLKNDKRRKPGPKRDAYLAYMKKYNSEYRKKNKARILKKRKEYYKKNKEIQLQKVKIFRKTKEGIICRVLEGLKRPDRWRGQVFEICDRDTFYNWALNDKKFNMLYDRWVASGYSQLYKPSILRLCNAIGYIPTNLEWVTFQDKMSLVQGGH